MQHTITVDDEVYTALKKCADPFVDTTPNSVLRRLLIISNKKHQNVIPSPSSDEKPVFSPAVPSALQQILEVVYLVKKSGHSRVDATKLVAKQRGISFQSVLDKYCRQLNMKAFEIDIMLDQDITSLCKHISDRFPRHRELIDEFFSSFEPSKPTDTFDPREFWGAIKTGLTEKEIENDLRKMRDEWDRNF